MDLQKLIAADLDTFNVEVWLEEMEVKGNSQENLAVTTCQAFLDEVSALCH